MRSHEPEYMVHGGVPHRAQITDLGSGAGGKLKGRGNPEVLRIIFEKRLVEN
jgi:hypothetical protein